MKKVKLTKDDLLRLGIEDITEDGRVFRNGHELKQTTLIAKHKYGKDKCYKSITIYDSSLSKKYKYRSLLVHRMVWAWFHGETPNNLDVCHKDDNGLNNSLSNLTTKSHKENLAERAGFRNQYQVINAYKALRGRLCPECQAKIDELIKGE